MHLGKIVQNYRTENGLSMREFGKKCGLSSGYISMLEKNRNPQTGKEIIPSIDTVKQIADAMGTTIDSLLTAIDNDSVYVNQKNNNEATIPNYKNITPLPKTKKVPLLGAIACGDPITAVENIDSYVEVPEWISADFTLTCKGDSMVDARIFDGDTVYIREQPEVENGEIAAVLIDDEATLKRVYYQKNKIILQPENKNYEPLVYVGEEILDVRILGKAVYFLSRVR